MQALLTVKPVRHPGFRPVIKEAKKTNGLLQDVHESVAETCRRHQITLMKPMLKSIAVTCLTLGLATAVLGTGQIAQAQDDMHGVDMLHPGAQFAPQMPSGLSPSGGPMTPPAASSGGAQPPANSVYAPGTPPGTSDIHNNPFRNYGSCDGSSASPNQQIGSDKTFCGYGKK